MERSERTQSQAAEPNGRQQAAVALGVGDEVGVGQAGPEEGGRKNHRGEGHPDGEREPLTHVGHEPGQRGQHRLGRAGRCRSRRGGTRRSGGSRSAVGPREHRQEHRHDLEQKNEGAHRQLALVVLAGEPAGEDDGDDAVGADDL